MKSSKVVTLLTTVISLLGLLFITFCKKAESGNTKLNIYLLDAPAYYKAVYIDIQKIMVKYDGSGNEQEVKLDHPGVYNLLDFANGIDTLLTSISMPPGNINQIRIVFGPDNTFINDSENITLNLSSEIENGLIIKTDQKIEADKINKLWIDVDASRSVIHSGNSIYNLWPVVRVFSNNVAGGIRGIVIPEDRIPFVYAVADLDSVGTITDSRGRFLIRGLAGGMYKMRFICQKPGIHEAVIDSIVVKDDSIKFIGTVVIN